MCLYCTHPAQLYCAQSVGISATSVLRCSEKVRDTGKSRIEKISIERKSKWPRKTGGKLLLETGNV